MSGIPSVNESRERIKSDWESPEGGYTAADGSVQYSRSAAKPAATPESKASESPKPQAESASEATPHPEAVKSLTRRAPVKLPAKPPTHDSNARTAARKPGADASAGITSTGDSAYAGVAALKGRGTQKEDVELGSGSIQVGAQTEVQAGMARVGIQTSKSTRGSMDVFTGRAAAGIHNPDGSMGLNASATATVVEFGASYENGATSFGVTAAVGFEIGGSIGVKDADADGHPELCARVPIGPVTISGCGPVGVASEQQSDTPQNGTSGTGGRTRDERAEGTGGAGGR